MIKQFWSKDKYLLFLFWFNILNNFEHYNNLIITKLKTFKILFPLLCLTSHEEVLIFRGEYEVLFRVMWNGLNQSNIDEAITTNLQWNNISQHIWFQLNKWLKTIAINCREMKFRGSGCPLTQIYRTEFF